MTLGFLASPLPLVGYRPLVASLAFTPVFPVEDYLFFLRFEPILLEAIRGQASSRPFSELPGCVYESIIEVVAHRYKVSPLLFKTVIKAESRYDFIVVFFTSKGAVDLIKVMPATRCALDIINFKDPTMNIEVGVKYLRRLLILHHDDERLAITAYNYDPEALK